MKWIFLVAHASAVVEGLVRSRHVRLLVAFMLLALSAWAFLPHVAFRIASTAFVNAELVRVTAPMAGRLVRDLPRKGDMIDHTVTVSLTETMAPDRRHLLDLEQQSAVAKDREELAKQQLVEVATIDRELENRTDAYRNGMVLRLSQEIVEAEAEKTGCLAEVVQRRDIGARMGELVKSGYASQIRSAEASATQEANAARCEMTDARIARFKIELAAAQNRVFLRDGANDVPYSQQQRDRLVLRRQDLQTEMLQQRSHAVQLETEIAEERHRLDRISHSDLLLPADHVVWSVSASPGSTVTEGQNILDLANCARRFVVVDLPERDFERVKAGDSPSVRLIGSDEWRQGKVRRVLGSAARTDDRLLAAQIPRGTLSSIAVEVELAQEDSDTDRNSFCNVGRMAEVRFQRAGLGFAEWIFKALPLLTGGKEVRQAAINATTSN
jgi:multidrug resistance efflux pump